MERQRKREPIEYPIFSFRVSEEDKVKLTKKIVEVTTAMNDKLKDDRIRIRKNEVIFKALMMGLKSLKLSDFRIKK